MFQQLDSAQEIDWKNRNRLEEQASCRPWLPNTCCHTIYWRCCVCTRVRQWPFLFQIWTIYSSPLRIPESFILCDEAALDALESWANSL